MPSTITGFDTNFTNATSIMVTWKEADGKRDSYAVSIESREGSLDKRNTMDTTARFSGLHPVTSYNITVITQSGNMKSDPYTASFTTKANGEY